MDTEIKKAFVLQTSMTSDAFEALLEVLNLTPEQVSKFHSLCDEKLQQRENEKNEVMKIFKEMLKDKGITS
ncbi:MAG TPA: hypothetical protein CFH84_10020 [Sulfurimonas sp. UBA12504]|nr:MAG TPA: hypothetical protein CFH84_10020 [Sulfurimonas sp. UBA12504]